MKILFVVSSLLLAVGCGHGPAVAPVRASVGAQGAVRVELRKVQSNILKFVVFNDTQNALVIDRDQVTVHTPQGDLHRMAGGSEGTYNLPAGGAHEVNVRFDFGEIPKGAQLEVHFEHAITNKGQATQVDPIIVARE